MRQRGIMFVIALGVTGIVAAASAALLVQAGRDLIVSERMIAQSAAFHLADAAVDQALVNLRSGDTNNIAATSIITGTFWTETTPLGANVYRVVTHGLSLDGNDQRNIEAVIAVSLPGAYTYGVFANGTIKLKNNSGVDSYDSALGPYGASNRLQNGDVGTNATGPATITLTNHTTIKGDAIIGPGGDATTAGGEIVLENHASITGNSGVLLEVESLTSDEFPSGSATEALTLSGDETLFLPEGTYRYTHVNVKNNAKVNVTGDVTLYVEDSFKLSNHAKFITSDCGTCAITVYIEGSSVGNALQVSQNSELSADMDPTRLAVYVTGNGSSAGNVKINNHGKLYGTVDAPLSSLEVNNNARVYGALVADNVELNNHAKVHYDEALLMNGGGLAASATLRSWREL